MITEERLSTIEKCLRKVTPVNSSRSRHYQPDFSSTSLPKAPVSLATRFTRLRQPFPSPHALNHSSEGLGTTRSFNRMVKRPFPLKTSSPITRKSAVPEGGKVWKLNEFIETCNRPESGFEQRSRRKSPKLSVSFQELKECLGATWAENRETEAFGTVIKQMKRRKREEARNITDKATLRVFVAQRREVSNYIITNFRRLPVWKHAGTIVPHKLEECLSQFRSDPSS